MKQGAAPDSRLAPFLRRNQEVVLAAWREQTRSLPSLSDLPRPVAQDHVPELLDRLCDAIEQRSADAMGDLPVQHAIHRLDHAFTIDEMVAEYRVLRSVILTSWSEAVDGALLAADVNSLNEILDHAVEVAVHRYASARERLLQAITNVSSAAYNATELRGFLDQLLKAAERELHAVAGCALFLPEGDDLVVWAASGAVVHDAVGIRVRQREGLAGRAAASCTPSASADLGLQLSMPSSIWRDDVIDSYCAPLLSEGGLVGVLCVGTLPDVDLSEEDRLFLRMITSRAEALLELSRAHERERAEWARAEARAAELEKALKERERAVEVLELGDACFVLDRDWNVIFVNKNQERLSGRPRAETLGNNFWELWPETRELQFWDAYHRARDQREPVAFEEYFEPLELWTGVTAYPTTEGGIAVFFRDISGRKQLERARLEEARFHELLVSVLAHDLRSPLSALALGIAMLAHAELDPRGEQMLARMKSASRRMQRMIEQTLDVARTRRTGTLPIARAPADLAVVTRSVIGELELANPDRQIVFAARGDTRATLDEDRVAQVVSNLTSNALSYGEPNTPVHVEVRREDGAVALEVANEGPPIPDERAATLFDPFRRLDRARTHSEGLGLGLYIVKQIVDAHGGEVRVRSLDGVTRFVALFPVDERPSNNTHGEMA